MLDFLSRSMQVVRWILVPLILSCCANSGTNPTPARPLRSKRPNIIVITLDTTRADRMGFLGSKRGLTPSLDALARQGIVFTRAYAQVPLTTPSHASIFTGTYPQFNQLNFMGQALTDDLPYLPDLLKHHGYKTAAFVGSLIIDSKNAVAAGFGRGFDTYDAPFHNRGKGEDRYRSVERRAQDVVSHSLVWLKSHSQTPFFVWVHCYDPHAPYDPPEPYKSRFSSELYDGEIAYTDSAIGRLLNGLHEMGLYENTMIALMADHGEALGEHGEHHHGIFLYDETVHVPLLLKLPQNRFAGKRVDGRVRLVDVAPTILELARIPVPTAVQGESMLAMINPRSEEDRQSHASADRPAYSESDYAHRAFGWSALRSWRTGKYLYVDAPERELYDQTVDAGAMHNLAPTAKAVADTLQAQSERFRRETSRMETVKRSLSPEQSESLRALGYVGTDTGPTAEGEDRGPDPKGKTDIADLLDQALMSIQDQKFEEAIPKLQEVLRAEPSTPLAYLELGRAYVELKDPEKAIPYLRASVEKLPNDTLARLTLGRALVETRQWAEAAPEFESALKINPNSAELHFYLAVVYQRAEKIPDAMQEFTETVRLNPDHFRANLLLGRLYGMQRDGARALPYLRHAEELNPQSIEVHMFLANVYTEVGQIKNAEKERAEVERLKSVRPN